MKSQINKSFGSNKTKEPKLENTAHKTYDWARRTSLETRDELRCSGSEPVPTPLVATGCHLTILLPNRIVIRCLFHLFILLFCDTLTSNDIMSANLSFFFDRHIIRKRIKYRIVSNGTTLGMCFVLLLVCSLVGCKCKHRVSTMTLRGCFTGYFTAGVKGYMSTLLVQ